MNDPIATRPISTLSQTKFDKATTDSLREKSMVEQGAVRHVQAAWSRNVYEMIGSPGGKTMN